MLEFLNQILRVVVWIVIIVIAAVLAFLAIMYLVIPGAKWTADAVSDAWANAGLSDVDVWGGTYPCEFTVDGVTYEVKTDHRAACDELKESGNAPAPTAVPAAEQDDTTQSNDSQPAATAVSASLEFGTYYTPEDESEFVTWGPWTVPDDRVVLFRAVETTGNTNGDRGVWLVIESGEEFHQTARDGAYSVVVPEVAQEKFCEIYKADVSQGAAASVVQTPWGNKPSEFCS